MSSLTKFPPRLLAVALMGLALTSAQAGEFRVPWLNGALLGMGYDASSGNLTREVCAKVSAEDRDINGGGPNDGLRFERIESREQFISKMLAELSGEAKYAALTASARISFARSINITQKDQTMFIQNIVSTVETGSTREGLLPIYGDMSSDVSQFRRRCGTHYVSTIMYGGELLMTLQSSDRDEQKRSKFEANVRAAGAAGKGSATYTQSVTELKNHDELRIVGRKAGGGSTTPYSVDTFVDEVSGFRSQVLANRKANVLYAIVSPYPERRSDPKSDMVDLASDKLLAFNEKLERMQDATEDPEMYDIDRSTLPAAVSERDRLRKIRDRLRTSIEACIYPVNTDGDGPNQCRSMQGFITPPSAALDDFTPKRFASDCRIGPIQLPKQQFRGKAVIKGDNLVGGWMNIQFEAAPIVSDERHVLRMKVMKRATEPGTSKKSSEEDVHETIKEIPIWSSSGCVINKLPEFAATEVIRFEGDFGRPATHSFRKLVDQASCGRVGSGGGGGRGFRAAPSSSFDCDVTLQPIRGLDPVHEELFQGVNKIRARKPFKGLLWLGAAGPE
ncbi:hypothetical protein [Bosea sp. NBC_00550]|uniref:hypothetical protein n=1 Tax=Bosea sp. NBC_00550 TaxID=2969621 RepID=UPI002231B5B3|nr:hypothetical protein [Bosea sp. NBC_00550]UZF92070.1 hypothetical protein NWE53_23775 [Bosea sp. NBC_00550]